MTRLRKIITIIFMSFVFSALVLPSGVIPYTVAEAAVKVALNKSAISVYTGNTYTLTVSGTKNKIKWSTSNKAVATVSAAGKVTGIKKGTATITAAIGTKKYTCKVTVKDYSISSKTLTLYETGKKTLKINGAAGTVTWKSSNTKVASVSKTGAVTAKSQGTAKITGTYNKKTYTCTVTVKNRIQADIADLTISEQAQVKITVHGRKKDETISCYADTDVIKVETGSFSGDFAPLTITPLKDGTATITVSTNYKSKELKIKVIVKDRKLSAEEIAKLCGESSVQINTASAAGSVIGSGFYIAENRIVTNYHVIKGATSIQIQRLSGETYSADSILGYSEELDIAVLGVSVKGKPLPVNTHNVTVGETVYTIGSSQGLTGTFTNGIVSNASRSFDNVDYIQINAAITNGNSGGPLVNEYGEVIGINTMQYIDGQNLNFAINIKQLDKVSLDQPVTALQFYQANTADLINDTGESDFPDNFIMEDDYLNDNILTAQTVTSGSMIGGFIVNYDVDYYKLVVTSTTYITVVAVSDESGKYLNYMYMGILDSNNNIITTAYYDTYEGTPYMGMYQYLQPGTYYLCLVPDPDVFLLADIPYVLIIQY